MTGVCRTTNTVTLFLYEGNKKVQLTADTYNTVSGEPFNAKFNLLNLKNSTTNFENLWMDIKFILGEVDGADSKTAEINIDNVDVDITNVVYLDGYVYKFAVYNNLLKVFYKASSLNYNLNFVNSPNEQLVISGNIYDPKFYGKYFGLSFQKATGAESDILTCLIGNDGSYSIAFDLSLFKFNVLNYFHTYVFDTNDTTSTNLLLKDGQDGKIDLLPGDCLQICPKFASNLGGADELTHGFSYTASDENIYHVGYKEGKNYMAVYPKDVSLKTSLRTIEDGSDKGVYLDIVDTYEGSLPSSVYIDLQHNGDAEQILNTGFDKNWNYHYNNDTIAPVNVVGKENHYRLSVRLDNLVDGEHNVNNSTFAMGVHYKKNSKNKGLDFTYEIGVSTVTFENVKYTITSDLRKHVFLDYNASLSDIANWVDGKIFVVTEPVING